MGKSVREKYQFKPFPGSSHSWAMKQLMATVDSMRNTLLDIGCGRGDMGDFAKKIGVHKCVAIEPDRDARKAVEDIYSKVFASISELESAATSPECKSCEKFHVVLLLDVLEHMAEPEKFLRALRPHIATGGTVLISVPNVAHWSVRLGLFFGHFDYGERGILDRTHLQFFTTKRAKRIINELPDAHMISYEVSLEPVEYFLPATLWQSTPYGWITKLRMWLAQVMPGLLGYQHLLVVRVGDNALGEKIFGDGA
jgi:2-polyprenyl-3-methyl-5-hydroxy-6-metoxy-1,4-benzoquinol methylase